MLNRYVLGVLTFVFGPALFANTSITVKNNTDVPVTLSHTNYNRIVMKNDKIVDFAFPDGAMGLKRDEQDGSVYVIPTIQSPFTLFLATESGRHFSVTVNSEDSLGKTIELVPNFQAPVVQPANRVAQALPKESAEQNLISLIQHMENHKPIAGFTVKDTRKVERWKKGLTLTKRQIWQGNKLQGEVIELYNGGRTPLILDETWFNQADTQALKFSQKELPAKQTAFLYRVSGGAGEINHG